MAEENRLTLNLEAVKEGRLLNRDDELDALIGSMQNSVNAYVYGPAGLGKTSVLKKAIEKFNEGRNKAVYVNCSTCRTEYSVLREIIDQVNSNFTQKIFIETRSNYDLAKRLRKEKENKFPNLKAVVLDHLEALHEGKVVDGLLDIGFTIILVSDEQKAINKLDDISQSSFANRIQFTPYSQEQIVKILYKMAEQLVGGGRFKSPLILKIAQQCNGNLRYGKSLLVASVLKAIGSKKDLVDESDIPDTKAESELTRDENLIVEILKEQHSAQGGRLYQMYCQRTTLPKAERTFRNYMKGLAEKKMVKAVGTNKGRVYETIG